MTREATKKMLEIAEQVAYSPESILDLVRDLLNFMSEDEVLDFAESNGYIDEEEDEEEEEDEPVYVYRTEEEIRAAFKASWGISEDDKPALRESFVAFVDYMQREGFISEKLANFVTLQGAEELHKDDHGDDDGGHGNSHD